MGYEYQQHRLQSRILRREGHQAARHHRRAAGDRQALKEWNGTGSYGIAVRGTATGRPSIGYMTLFSTWGAKDSRSRTASWSASWTPTPPSRCRLWSSWRRGLLAAVGTLHGTRRAPPGRRRRAMLYDATCNGYFQTSAALRGVRKPGWYRASCRMNPAFQRATSVQRLGVVDGHERNSDNMGAAWLLLQYSQPDTCSSPARMAPAPTAPASRGGIRRLQLVVGI